MLEKNVISETLLKFNLLKIFSVISEIFSEISQCPITHLLSLATYDFTLKEYDNWRRLVDL